MSLYLAKYPLISTRTLATTNNSKKSKVRSAHSLLALVICCVSGCTVTNEREVNARVNQGEPNKRVEATTGHIIDSFSEFLKRNSINKGAIAVSYKGNLVGSAGKNRTAADPARLASLSKAITAVCVMKALETSRHTVNSTLQALIPKQLSSVAIGMEKFGPITIEQLITHTSGIRTKHLSLQGRYIRRYEREQKNWQLGNILKYKPSTQRKPNYYYSNANYLILGMVIEQITKSDYETYCNKTVLTPLKITSAKLSPRWRILSSYAGWEVSAVDYLRFVNAYFTNEWKTKLAAARSFKPFYKGSKKYGLGVWMHETRQGIRFWHAGSITWNSSLQNARFASFFASYENGFSVSLNYSKDSKDGRGAELEKILYSAITTH